VTAMKLYRWRQSDLGFRLGTGAFALALVVMVLGIGFELCRQSLLSIHKFGLGFWATDIWDPVAGDFGARPFIWGTLYSSVLALCIATPISLGIAVYLSELCPSWFAAAALISHGAARRNPVDRVWIMGIFVLVPLVRQLELALPDRFRALPLFSGPADRVGMLSAALILAVMVTPFTSSIAREVLKPSPLPARRGLRAGRNSLGGIRAALFYGASESSARSCSASVVRSARQWPSRWSSATTRGLPWSLFAPQYTMAAVIANEFTEASGDLYLSALVEIGLVLFIITLIVNTLSRLLIWSMASGPASRRRAAGPVPVAEGAA